MRFLYIVVMLALAANAAYAAQGTMKKLSFVPQGEGIWKAKYGAYEIILTDTLKSKATPEVWDGDLAIRNSKTGHPCRLNVSMVAEVYGRERGNSIISVTEVGAGEYFHFINVETCSEKYTRLHAYSKRPHIQNNRIVSGPVCERLGNNKASCTQAEIYALDADDRPVLLEKESLAHTQQVVGVAFMGERLVENPETKNAKLLPEEKEEGWFSSVKKLFSH